MSGQTIPAWLAARLDQELAPLHQGLTMLVDAVREARDQGAPSTERVAVIWADIVSGAPELENLALLLVLAVERLAERGEEARPC